MWQELVQTLLDEKKAEYHLKKGFWKDKPFRRCPSKSPDQGSAGTEVLLPLIQTLPSETARTRPRGGLGNVYPGHCA